MFVIVSHHLFTYSQIPLADDLPTYIFNNLFNDFSKAGCIGFILITGYFSIEKEMKPSRILRLAIEIWFYTYLINFILILTGKVDFSWEVMMNTLFPIILCEWWFLTYYIIIMLLSPIINKGLNSISRGQFQFLLLILVLIAFIIPTMTHKFQFSELLIMFTGYCIGGYLKLYPGEISKDLRFNAGVFFATITSLLIGIISVFLYMDNGGLGIASDTVYLIFIVYMLVMIALLSVCIVKHMSKLMIVAMLIAILFGNLINILYNNYLAADMMNYPWNGLMLFSAVSLFIVFINLKPRNVKLINILSPSILAIYIIHYHTYLREFIFERVDLISWIDSQWYEMYAIASVFCIMIGCIIIDLIRRGIFYAIYRQLSEKIDKVYEKVDSIYYNFINQ